MRPMPELVIHEIPVAELVPYAHNAKKHPEKQVDEIANSIDAFGNCDPIGVWHNEQGQAEIVEGHGRVLALQKLGIETAPVIFLDHLTDEQRRIYTHVHNQTTLSSDFDQDALIEDMDNLNANWEDFGFEEYLPDYDEETGVEETAVPEVTENRCKLGDIWQLGEHRVMCGSAADAENVAKLMDGNRADVCFTSPPYNMSAGGSFDGVSEPNMGGGNMYGEYDDNLDDDEYSRLLIDSLGNALAFCDDALFNIGIIKGSKAGIFAMIAAHRANFCDVLVWKKRDALPMGVESQRALVKHVCELIFCFNQKGNRAFSHPQWKKGCGTNIVETDDSLGNEYSHVHHATFPVSLAASIVRNYTESSVLDLFGGTGTTLVAAEQLGRKCYMMELDPHYCDVIITRWEEMTGKVAARLD